MKKSFVLYLKKKDRKQKRLHNAKIAMIKKKLVTSK